MSIGLEAGDRDRRACQSVWKAGPDRRTIGALTKSRCRRGKLGEHDRGALPCDTVMQAESLAGLLIEAVTTEPDHLLILARPTAPDAACPEGGTRSLKAAESPTNPVAGIFDEPPSSTPPSSGVDSPAWEAKTKSTKTRSSRSRGMGRQGVATISTKEASATVIHICGWRSESALNGAWQKDGMEFAVTSSEQKGWAAGPLSTSSAAEGKRLQRTCRPVTLEHPGAVPTVLIEAQPIS